jgi:hypothetical protein
MCIWDPQIVEVVDKGSLLKGILNMEKWNQKMLVAVAGWLLLRGGRKLKFDSKLIWIWILMVYADKDTY